MFIHLCKSFVGSSQDSTIVPRSRTSTNWKDASTAIGPLWVTRIECAVGEWHQRQCTCVRAGGGHEHTL